MKIGIKTKVMYQNKEKELELIEGKDSIIFSLNGREIFSADWSKNIALVFEKALEMFGEDKKKK